ncbi:hypothetical protein [Roseivivax isoporae]|uniref:Ada DNA repair metal-binding domain-containing protein n=1 Tax=Roseivivax isoporae LMG 25204 TaxID=1449351 RepID=X7FAE2_9RHOB|nr:hypothetical protein [Roseivivax isoporae]ETX29892.1 hypothetical protein RISW2_19765 [Roseivivax isoporae LMG 25204]
MGEPRRNRVTPHGEIVAHAARGTVMGNRGILHGPDGTLGRARWRHHAWVACLLDFKGRRRRIMAPGSYTELFFTDEAVALAAGHRPCGECRRIDYLRFRDAMAAADPALGPAPGAGDLDRVMHAARVDPRSRRQVTHAARLDALPDGAFFEDVEGAPATLHDGRCLRWTPEGYVAIPRPGGTVRVLTPAPTVAALQAGYALRGWAPDAG